MGTRVIQLIQDDPALTLGAALDRPDHPRQGEDVGPVAGLGPLGVPIMSTLDRPVGVMIDLSTPAGTLALAKTCAERGVPLAVGTTGFEPEQRRELERAAGKIPLLISSNFSKAVHLL